MGGCGPRTLRALGDDFDELRLVNQHLPADANNRFIETVAGNFLASAVEPVTRVENKVSDRGLGPAGIPLGELPDRE
jgi:hypothetical protein